MLWYTPVMNLAYNDHFDPEDQVDTEEQIAALILGGIESLPEEASGNDVEGLCADLGRRILLLVLGRFREDLVEENEDQADKG